MKIISEEERQAHMKTILLEGAKGLAVGAACSLGLATWIKRRHAGTWSAMSNSVKAALYAIPTIGVSAFYADDGSYKFDIETHQSDYLKQQRELELQRWERLSTSDKIFSQLNDNKYKIIVGAWAATLYGSWKIVDRDQYMSKAQKAVQARVYAQAFTVVLLLGTILLSLREQEIKKKEPAPVPEWKKYLDEQESMKKQHEREVQEANNKNSEAVQQN